MMNLILLVECAFLSCLTNKSSRIYLFCINEIYFIIITFTAFFML